MDFTLEITRRFSDNGQVAAALRDDPAFANLRDGLGNNPRAIEQLAMLVNVTAQRYALAIAQVLDDAELVTA